MQSIILNNPNFTASSRATMGHNQMDKTQLTQEDLTTNELESRIKDVKKQEVEESTEKRPYDGFSEKDFINLSLKAYENNKRNEKSPDFRIFARKDNVNRYGKKTNWLSTGAIWIKDGKKGDKYMSLTLNRAVLVQLLKAA